MSIKELNMKYFSVSKIIFLTFLFSLNTTLFQAQNKNSPIERFLNKPSFKNASVGFCVKDLSGKEISKYNSKTSYTPASILKIITTATALETLGANYRYKTTLAKDKNNSHQLYIHGYGDPTLGTSFLNNTPTAFLAEWSKQVKMAFDSTTNIDITVIDNYWGYEGVSKRWIREDIGNYYGAGAYGISIFDNTYKLFFNTIRTDTCPIIIKTEPEMHDISFRNTMTLNTTGKDNGYILNDLFSNSRILTGDIPAGKTAFSIKGDIRDPGLYLAETLKDRLEKDGFTISHTSTTMDRYFKEMYSGNKIEPEEEIFYTHQSYPIKDIIRDVNVRSNNHYAEHLIRTIGRVDNKDIYTSPLDKGIEKTEEIWKYNGLDTDALFMYDGCGLAPSNAVSPNFMCDLLVYMQTKSKNADVFLNSFAKAGKEGTVRNLLKGTRLEGKVYVKSGSIANVQCFAGYYIDGDKKYAFTIMVNKFNGPRNQVVRAIQDLLLDTF